MYAFLRFKGFRKKAVTFSYDDAVTQDIKMIELMDKYGDRVKFIHLKDGFKNKEGKSLGQGTAPVKAVLAKAEATGRTVVVESEGLDPTGKEEVKRCIDFLLAQ